MWFIFSQGFLGSLDFDLQEAVELINNRPRKRLQYRTLKEVFSEKIAIRTRI
jgi:IS30 family transposase